MQKTTLRSTSLTAAAYFLIGTLSVAQAPSAAQKKLPGKMKSGTIALRANDGQAPPAAKGIGSAGIPVRDPQSSQTSGRSNSMQQNNNPLYEDKGTSGTNPLFESGKDAVVKPNTSTSGTVGYKDPEDMTTRKAGVKQEFGPDRSTKKHIAGVKYEDRTATGSSSSSSQSAVETGKQ